MSPHDDGAPTLSEIGCAPTDAQLRFIEAIEGAFGQDGAVFCGSTKRDAAAFIKEWAPRMRPFGDEYDDYDNPWDASFGNDGPYY